MLWRLVRHIVIWQPQALWQFCKILFECAKNNPRALQAVGSLAALYLHARPFSRFVISVLDRVLALGESARPSVLAPAARDDDEQEALPAAKVA